MSRACTALPITVAPSRWLAAGDDPARRSSCYRHAEAPAKRLQQSRSSYAWRTAAWLRPARAAHAALLPMPSLPALVDNPHRACGAT